MQDPRLEIALVDDWELRGDGSGDMTRIQFAALETLLGVYERFGLKASINAEIMQQIQHRRVARAFPECGRLADEWERLVLDAVRRGHDVQLHVHSQWLYAEFDGTTWTLPSNWSIVEHSEADVRAMLTDAKSYLESLVQQADPTYSCTTFRSGAWCIAPSEFILDVLADLGIVFDMSIAQGLRYNNAKVQLDYSAVDEGFEPFYPVMIDARKVASTVTRIVCIPTLTFRNSWRYVIYHDFERIVNTFSVRSDRARRAVAPTGAAGAAPEYSVWQEPTTIWDRIRRRIRPSLKVSDLSVLDYREMVEMIRSARRRASKRRLPVVPIVLENHTKDIRDFGEISRFAEYLAASSDVEVITLREMASRVSAGRYRIVSAGTKR